MTEKQEQTIKAFTDWMTDNGLDFLLSVSDGEDGIGFSNGSGINIAANLSALLSKNAGLKSIVGMALMLAFSKELRKCEED